jgi:hypothetical protein
MSIPSSPSRPPRRRALAVAAGAAVLALAGEARAEDPPVRGEDLRVSVLTFGFDPHPFFRFGHNAILVEDARGRGDVYNFGMFNFSSPALIPKFVLGRSMYWLARTPRDHTIASYIQDDRTVDLQELDLTPAQRLALYRRLVDNARPQNRYYLYDYFFNNCSTRVRDVIDAAIGGKLHAQAGAMPARLSFRGHALRLTADLTWEYVALAFGLGTTADRPITGWEEGFIPMELRDVLRQVRVPGDGGSSRPLVKNERQLYRSSRADPPVDPPRRMTAFLTPGVLLGAALALLGWFAGPRGRLGADSARWARLSLGSLTALLGFVGGLLGLLLVFLWTTNHRAAHANANILQAAPWALALMVYGVRMARGRRPVALRRAMLVAGSAAAASALGLLLRITGLVAQDNYMFIALFLPLWTGMAAGLWLAQPLAAADAAPPTTAGKRSQAAGA